MKKRTKIVIVLTVIFLIPAMDFVYGVCTNEAKALTGLQTGPFIYNGELYAFSDWETFPDERNTDELGYIHRDLWDNFSLRRSFLRGMEALPVLIGDQEDQERNYLKIRMENDFYAAKISELEESGVISEIIQQFDDFVLQECQEKYYDYGRDLSGEDFSFDPQKLSFDKKNVETLFQSYEDIQPRAEDFQHDNTVYLLKAGMPDMSEFLSKYYMGVYKVPGLSNENGMRLNPNFYVGILFYDNGKVYFGNYDNEITGELKNEILGAAAN